MTYYENYVIINYKKKSRQTYRTGQLNLTYTEKYGIINYKEKKELFLWER